MKYATEEQRQEARRIHRRRSSQKRNAACKFHTNRVAERQVPPPLAVIEEAARALSADRSLTAIAMGDPLPGRSALDRSRH